MDLTGAADAAQLGGASLGVLVAVAVAGLRHGFDIDHIAAISDIASSQRTRRRSFALATTYAIGHMIVVFALGAAAVMAGVRISAWTEAAASRSIGLTLVALGLYVMYSLIRFRRDFRMITRWMLITAGVRRVLHWIRPPRRIVIEHEHEHASGHHDHGGQTTASAASMGTGAVAVAAPVHAHRHRHVVVEPADPFTEYSGTTSFLIGMVHGVGAETPTQLILFTAAAGIGGTGGGIVLVASFVTALLLGNLMLTAIVTSAMAAGRRMPVIYMGLGAITAVLSLWVGAAYLLNRPDLLPRLLGG